MRACICVGQPVAETKRVWKTVEERDMASEEEIAVVGRDPEKFAWLAIKSARVPAESHGGAKADKRLMKQSSRVQSQ